MTFITAYWYLEDWTVLDLEDLDDEYRTTDEGRTNARTFKKRHSDLCDDDYSQDNTPGQSENSCEEDCRCLSAIPLDCLESALPVESMIPSSILKHWFPRQQYHNMEDVGAHAKPMMIGCSGSNGTTHTQIQRRSQLPHYKIYKTKYAKSENENGMEGEGTTTNRTCLSPFNGILQVLKQFIFILQMRNTWKVLVFSFASVPVVLQWTASEISLPPFLERRFGESIPIYTIQSIHMFGCLIFPPFAQAFTSALEDFRVVMPGVRT